jgi:hypothetical protein
LLENAFKGDADDVFESSYFGDGSFGITDVSFAAVSNLESPKEVERDERSSPAFGIGEDGEHLGGGGMMLDLEYNRSKTWRTNYVNKMKTDLKSGRVREMKKMSANIKREISNNVSSRSSIKGGGKRKKSNKTFDSGQTSLGQGRGNANVKAKIGRHGKVSVILEHDDSDLSDIDIENDDLNSDVNDDSD